jgi:hypothetical protein
MLETYQGVLRDNRIEWSGDAPKVLSPDHAVRVHVTVLDSVTVPVEEQGKRMAAALERLAALTKLDGIGGCETEG